MSEFVIRKEKNEHRRLDRGLWVIFIRAFSFCAFLLALTCTDAIAQALIITAPFGRPAMVMDENGKYSAAILVYSNSEMEAFVPDITTPGWISWNKDRFRETGSYHTYLYEHFIKESFCRREMLPVEHKADPNWLEACSELRYRRRLILVDTRKKNVTVLENIVMDNRARYNPSNQKKLHLTTPFSKLKKSMLLTVSRITAIIEKEVKQAVNTPSAQEIGHRNNEIVRDMAKKAYGSTQPPDERQRQQLRGGVAKDMNGNLISTKEFQQSSQGPTAVDWAYKANALWDGKKYTDPKQAIEYLNNAIKLKSNYAEAYINRGRAYAELGQYQRTIEDCNEAIRLKPDDVMSYINRGSAYVELGQPQRAIEDYNKVIHLQPDLAVAYINRADAYYDLGQYQRTIEDCNEAIRLQPSVPM